MADEARRTDAPDITAVGTAGLRIASNTTGFLDEVASRCGVRIEVISGEQESRLAYLAVKAGIGQTEGSLVVFDTGGGSSQFTFGHADVVEERWSVNVGAVGFSERFGLDQVCPTTCWRRRSTRSPPTSGASTAGRRRTGWSRSAAPSPTWLRSSTSSEPTMRTSCAAPCSTGPRSTARSSSTGHERADERRQIVGLQPKRAEVILAGACIVRTVLTKLGSDSLTVSDRGLRHGLLMDGAGGELT